MKSKSSYQHKFSVLSDRPTMSQLQTLEPFDCKSDPNSLCNRWEKWKRALDVYLTATGVNEPIKKRAVLLHTAGFALQEIYSNLSGAQVPETESNDVFNIAIAKLDAYFSPKQSFLFDIHLFRLLKQESEEKFENFLVRLRNQSSKCNFARKEDDLVDQIVEKCSSPDLRKKILQLGVSVTIDKIIMDANLIETFERQLRVFQGRATLEVNKIGTRGIKKSLLCVRCGSRNHDQEYQYCPARDKPCRKCGFLGHF